VPFFPANRGNAISAHFPAIPTDGKKERKSFVALHCCFNAKISSIASISGHPTKERLNRFIEDFEPLSYDRVHKVSLRSN